MIDISNIQIDKRYGFDFKSFTNKPRDSEYQEGIVKEILTMGEESFILYITDSGVESILDFSRLERLVGPFSDWLQEIFS